MIDEELAVQRGLALDLPEQDTDVRTAISDGLTALVTAPTLANPPSDDDLRAYFNAHRANYASQGMMAVTDLVLHVGGFENADQTVDQALADAKQAIYELRSGAGDRLRQTALWPGRFRQGQRHRAGLRRQDPPGRQALRRHADAHERRRRYRSPIVEVSDGVTHVPGDAAPATPPVFRRLRQRAKQCLHRLRQRREGQGQAGQPAPSCAAMRRFCWRRDSANEAAASCASGAAAAARPVARLSRRPRRAAAFAQAEPAGSLRASTPPAPGTASAIRSGAIDGTTRAACACAADRPRSAESHPGRRRPAETPSSLQPSPRPSRTL